MRDGAGSRTASGWPDVTPREPEGYEQTSEHETVPIEGITGGTKRSSFITNEDLGTVEGSECPAGNGAGL